MADDLPKIPTHIWLTGELRRIAAAGAPYYIVQKGENLSGTVMVKVITPAKTCALYQQNRDVTGVLGWLCVRPGGHNIETVEESWADAYIARAVSRDPDLWVVEIENRDLNFPLEGPVFDDVD